MRTVSSSYSVSIDNDELQVCEIYTIELRDGTVYRYTSDPSPVIWDSDQNTYTPLPIARGSIQFGMNFEPDTMDIYLPAIEGGLTTYLAQNNLDNCELTIKRILRNTSYSSDDEIIIFIGSADIEYDRQIITLHCKPWIDSLNIQVPRHTYQEGCNYSLYESGCSLDQSSFSYDGTATGGSQLTVEDTARGLVYAVLFDGGDIVDTIKKGDAITGSIGAGTAKVVNVVYYADDSNPRPLTTPTTGTIWYCYLSGTQFVDDEILTSGTGATVTVNGAPWEFTTLYKQGEVRIRSGNASGQRRPILSDQSYVITAMWPFPASIDNGTSYTIYPGCDGTGNTCLSWYDNEPHFRGFMYIPKVEDVMML
jgi:hypothetical protein